MAWTADREAASTPDASASGASPNSGTAGAGGERLCELCRKPLVAGREVTVTDETTQEEHLYRCIHCAIVAMQRQFPRSRAEAWSGVTHQRISLTRKGDTWQSEPAAAVLLVLPEAAGECLARHQIFAGRQEYQQYLDAHPEWPASVPTFDLSQVEEIIRAGLPQGEETAAAPSAVNSQP